MEISEQHTMTGRSEIVDLPDDYPKDLLRQRNNRDKFFPAEGTMIYDNTWFYPAFHPTIAMESSQVAMESSQECSPQITDNAQSLPDISLENSAETPTEKWYPCAAGEKQQQSEDGIPETEKLHAVSTVRIAGRPIRLSLSLRSISAILGGILVLLGVYYWWRASHTTASIMHLPPQSFPQIPFSVISTTPPSPSLPAVETKYVISVVGAIAHPGIYRLDPQARVNDAIISAGPLLSRSSLDGLNRAEVIEDGEQIVIGAFPTKSYIEYASSSIRRININTASIHALVTVPGISTAVANSIVEYRKEHGKFHNLADLLQISGIKAARLAKIQPYLLCI